MKFAVEERKAMILGSTGGGAEGFSFFDMDSAFKDLSVGDKGKGAAKEKALVENAATEAEMEKYFAAREYAAKEKALERAEALAAKEFAVKIEGLWRRSLGRGRELVSRRKSFFFSRASTRTSRGNPRWTSHRTSRGKSVSILIVLLASISLSPKFFDFFIVN